MVDLAARTSPTGGQSPTRRYHELKTRRFVSTLVGQQTQNPSTGVAQRCTPPTTSTNFSKPCSHICLRKKSMTYDNGKREVLLPFCKRLVFLLTLHYGSTAVARPETPTFGRVSSFQTTSDICYKSSFFEAVRISTLNKSSSA